MTREVYALLIGANQPPHKQVLPASVDVVMTMTQFLVLRFGSAVRIDALICSQATRASVRSKLKAASQLSPDSLFILMFSGHGGDTGHNRWTLNDGVLTNGELATALDAIDPSIEIFVANDCCFASGWFARAMSFLWRAVPFHSTLYSLAGRTPWLLRVLRGVIALTRPSRDIIEQFKASCAELLRPLLHPDSVVMVAAASGTSSGGTDFIDTLCLALPTTDGYVHLIERMKQIKATSADWSLYGTDTGKARAPLLPAPEALCCSGTAAQLGPAIGGGKSPRRARKREPALPPAAETR